MSSACNIDFEFRVSSKYWPLRNSWQGWVQIGGRSTHNGPLCFGSKMGTYRLHQYRVKTGSRDLAQQERMRHGIKCFLQLEEHCTHTIDPDSRVINQWWVGDASAEAVECAGLNPIGHQTKTWWNQRKLTFCMDVLLKHLTDDAEQGKYDDSCLILFFSPDLCIGITFDIFHSWAHLKLTCWTTHIHT